MAGALQKWIQTTTGGAFFYMALTQANQPLYVDTCPFPRSPSALAPSHLVLTRAHVLKATHAVCACCTNQCSILSSQHALGAVAVTLYLP